MIASDGKRRALARVIHDRDCMADLRRTHPMSTYISNAELQLLRRPGSAAGGYIPYRAMLSEHDVLTWQGTLMRLWRLDAERAGAMSCCADPRHDRRSSWPALAIAGRHALWLHRFGGPCNNGAPARDSHATYMTLVYQPRWSRLRGWARLTRTSLHRAYAAELPIMQAASTALMEYLADLQPHLLGDYFADGRHCNEAFDFLSFLVNGIWAPRVVLAGPLDQTLPHASPDTAPLWSTPPSRHFLRDALRPFPLLVAGEPLCGSAC